MLSATSDTHIHGVTRGTHTLTLSLYVPLCVRMQEILWQIPIWCGWPGLPWSSHHRLALVSSSSCCACFWTPPILKCQPACTDRKGRMAGGGLPCRYYYVIWQSLWLMLTRMRQNLKRAGKIWIWMNWWKNWWKTQTVNTEWLKSQVTKKPTLRLSSDFVGLLEFHSWVWCFHSFHINSERS